jgi:hypothetical protein
MAVALALSPTAAPADPPTREEAQAIATEAYVYCYPLVLMDVTRLVGTNAEAGKTIGRGPANTFVHVRAYPTAEFTDVVRPNFDTLYSVAWLDLRQGPMVVSAPDTHGRYYLLPMIDMWTDVFAVPGKRTGGTGAASWAVIPPGWRGTLPAGMKRIDSPTPFVWVIGRTQTNGPKDYDAVHAVQDGYRITPLPSSGRGASPPAVRVDPTIDMKTPPMDQVANMTGDQFFTYAARLMKVNPPHGTDWSILARMRRLGIEAGRDFDPAKADPVAREAIAAAPGRAKAAILAKLAVKANSVNGWQVNTENIGVFGNSYLQRAAIAMAGLGANQPEDAIYPLAVSDAEGKPIDASNRYVMHFTKAELPPVEAFWSVTMYNAKGFPVANPIDRYAIGDRDALKYNPDGSLDLYIQHDSPGGDKVSNWLPAPASGRAGLTMRLYAPRAEALDKRWSPPPIRRVTR